MSLRAALSQITLLPKDMLGSGHFALYDMTEDPGEIHDVSKEHAEVYQELLCEWERYVTEARVFWPPQKAVDKPKSTLAPINRRAPKDSIGGDPIEQCTAWMTVGEGEVAAPTLPSYTHILA